MVTWNNLDTLASFQELSKVERVNLVEAMSGENGADRVKNYSVPMAGGFSYNYAAKQVDDKVLAALVKLAEEAQLAEKFEALYNGEVIMSFVVHFAASSVTDAKCCQYRDR